MQCKLTSQTGCKWTYLLSIIIIIIIMISVIIIIVIIIIIIIILLFCHLKMMPGVILCTIFHADFKFVSIILH